MADHCERSDNLRDATSGAYSPKDTSNPKKATTVAEDNKFDVTKTSERTVEKDDFDDATKATFSCLKHL